MTVWASLHSLAEKSKKYKTTQNREGKWGSKKGQGLGCRCLFSFSVWECPGSTAVHGACHVLSCPRNVTSSNWHIFSSRSSGFISFSCIYLSNIVLNCLIFKSPPNAPTHQRGGGCLNHLIFKNPPPIHPKKRTNKQTKRNLTLLKHKHTFLFDPWPLEWSGLVKIGSVPGKPVYVTLFKESQWKSILYKRGEE